MDWVTLRVLVFNVAMLAGGIPLIIYFYKHGFKNIPKKNIFFGYIVFIAFSSFYEVVFTQVFRINTIPWIKFYSLVDFLFIYGMFRIHVPSINKRFLNFLLGTFIALYLIFLIFFNSIDYLTADGYLTIVIIILLLFGFISWLINIFKNPDLEELYHDPFFWLVSGLLIFNISGVMLYLLNEYIIISIYSLKNITIFNNIVLLIFRILVSVATWKGLVK
jgi:hypothetical protein